MTWANFTAPKTKLEFKDDADLWQAMRQGMGQVEEQMTDVEDTLGHRAEMEKRKLGRGNAPVHDAQQELMDIETPDKEEA